MADGGLKQQRVLLIDVGGLVTDIGLFAESVLQASAIVPWGGLCLASTIAKDLHVTMDQAVTWSLEGNGCRKPEVRARISDGWTELQRAIKRLLKDHPRPDAAFKNAISCFRCHHSGMLPMGRGDEIRKHYETNAFAYSI